MLVTAGWQETKKSRLSLITVPFDLKALVVVSYVPPFPPDGGRRGNIGFSAEQIPGVGNTVSCSHLLIQYINFT